MGTTVNSGALGGRGDPPPTIWGSTAWMPATGFDEVGRSMSAAVSVGVHPPRVKQARAPSRVRNELSVLQELRERERGRGCDIEEEGSFLSKGGGF